MPLSPEQINRIVELARLDLPAGDLETISRQLVSIIEYVDLMAEADTEGVGPLPQVNATANVLRADEVVASGEATRRAMLDQFPEADGDLLKVQAILP